MNIYGCEFAKGDQGVKAVKYLEAELGVKIAASDDVTGKDGDWELEVGNHFVQGLKNYKYNLQCRGIVGRTGPNDDFDGDGICNNIDIDDDNDGILDEVENQCKNVPVSMSADGTFDKAKHPSSTKYNSDISGTGWVRISGSPDSWSPPVSTLGSRVWGGLVDGMRASPQGSTFIGMYRSDKKHPEEIIRTTVSGLTVGSTYIVELYQANGGIDGYSIVNGDKARFRVNFGSETKYTPYMSYLGERHQVWEKVQLSFTATSTSQYLYFSGDHTSSRYVYMVMDDVKVYEECKPLDTDKDGIPNHLDLDSDGDGCPDAVEAGTAKQAKEGNTSMGDLRNKTEDGSIKKNVANARVGSGAPKDYGKNGFYNGIETNDSQTTTYKGTYTYSNAIDKEADGCIDTDGDGIPDIQDIDDDNDGVLDVKETLCKTGSKFITVSDGVKMKDDNEFLYRERTSEVVIDYPYSFQNFNVLFWSIDNGDKFTVSVKLDDGTLIGPLDGRLFFNTSDPSWAKRWTKKKYPGPSSNGDWSRRLTKHTGSPFGPADTYYAVTGKGWGAIEFAIPQATRTNAIDKIIINIKSTVNFLAIAEIEPLNSIPNCRDINTDQDGIPNRLDLDSDGDGCPDTVEAGTAKQAGEGNTSMGDLGTKTNDGGMKKNVANARIGSGVPKDYGENGFYNGLETNDLQTATYKGVYTYNDAMYKDGSKCIDTDGDGIPDIQDIDDDNDGILDVVETNEYTINTIIGKWKSEKGWGKETKNNSHDGKDDKLYQSGVVLKNNCTPYSKFTVKIKTTPNLSKPNLLDIINMYIGDKHLFKITNHSATQVTPPQTEVTKGKDYTELVKSFTINGKEVDNNGALISPGSYHDFELILNTATLPTTGKVVFEHSATGNTFYTNYIYYFVNKCINVDIDGDGIPNHLDLDSDGDGCPDTVEAGTAKQAGEGNTSIGDLGNKHEDGGMKKNVANARVGSGSPKDYGKNGFYNGIETNDLQTAKYKATYAYSYAIDKTTDFCTDTDDDTIPDFIDLDDDNDGILDEGECAQQKAPTSPFIPSWTAVGSTNTSDMKPGDIVVSKKAVNLNGESYDVYLKLISENRIEEGNETPNIKTYIHNGLLTTDGLIPKDKDHVIYEIFFVKSGEPMSNLKIFKEIQFNIYNMGNQDHGTETNYTDVGAFLTTPVYAFKAGKNLKEVPYGTAQNVYGVEKSLQSGTNGGSGFNTEPSNTISAKFANQGKYRFIHGISGTSSKVINNRGLLMSFHILDRFCDQDKDNIPNHLDLDSDGDLCPDIVESGVKDYIKSKKLSGELISGDVKNKDPKNPSSTTSTPTEGAMLNPKNGGDVIGTNNGFHDQLEHKNRPGVYNDTTYKKMLIYINDIMHVDKEKSTAIRQCIHLEE